MGRTAEDADASFHSVCCEGGGVLMIEKLNERITIEKSTVVTDKVGNHRNTWEEYFTCFAYASTYQAQEENGEVTAEQKSVVFTVRWCSETRGLTSTGFRIRFREQLYNIESVDPIRTKSWHRRRTLTGSKTKTDERAYIANEISTFVE